MTFLNVALLAGAAAFAVPLIIHLLNRSRFQVVPWAAMHLLEFSIPQNTRRFQWRALLLLLVRCLIPIALALCMARPLWTWWQSRQPGKVDNAVLLLDNSISMEALLPDDLQSRHPQNGEPVRTGYQFAVLQASKIAEQGREDGRFAVIPMAGPHERTSESEGISARSYVSRTDLENQTRAVSIGTEPVDLLRLLQTALATAQSFRRPASHVVLISDFRASDWEPISTEALAELKKRTQQTNPRVAITLLQVPVVETANRSVHFLAGQPKSTRVGQPLEISAVVRNDSPDSSGPISVIAQVDGADLGTKQLTLPARGQAQVSFLCRFDQPGEHQIEVRIKDDLPIAGDNATRMLLVVLPVLKCLIVDDSDASELLERDSGFLQLALGGTDKVDANETRPFEVAAVRADELNAELVMMADILVMANISRLTQETADAIAQRVADGAHLVLFPGDRVDRGWYAATWGPESDHRLLPAAWGELQQIDAAEPSLTVREQNWEHPALRLFNTQANGQLGRIESRRIWPLILAASPTEPNASTPAADLANTEDSSDTATPIAWLSNDTPWLVTRSVGRGHVLQSATSCGSSGSNWPLRPSFVPAIQRLLSAPFDNTAVVGDAAARESELQLLASERREQIAADLDAQCCNSALEYLTEVEVNSGGRELWQPLLWLTVVLLVGEVFLQKFLTRGPR